MIIKNAVQIGNPILRKKSLRVAQATSASAKKIVKDLVDSMRYHDLVGMAAPQIGIGKRIFVTEIRDTSARKPRELDPVRVFINPKIMRRSGKRDAGYEGCGSVARAGLFGKVSRAYEVTVAAYNERGERFKLRAKGLLARIIQHETDHLDGKVFLDRMGDMKSIVGREEYIGRRA